MTIDATLEIRRANKRDLEDWLQLCLAWQGAPATANPVLLRQLLKQTLSDDDSTVYLAFSDGSLLGFAHITFQVRAVRLGWRCTIEELHVEQPDTGIEQQFLNAIVHECRERGDVIALYLLTQPDLEPRQFEFYASLGFRERGREVLIWTGALL